MLDLQCERRQVGILHQGVETEAQRFGIHSGKVPDLDAQRQHVGIVPRGFGPDGLQHRTGYAHLVHDGGRFSDHSSGERLQVASRSGLRYEL